MCRMAAAGGKIKTRVAAASPLAPASGARGGEQPPHPQPLSPAGERGAPRPAGHSRKIRCFRSRRHAASAPKRRPDVVDGTALWYSKKEEFPLTRADGQGYAHEKADGDDGSGRADGNDGHRG